MVRYSFDAERLQEALVELDLALDEDASMSWLRVSRATARKALDDSDGALDDLDAYLGFAPHDIEGLALRYELRTEQGDIDGSLTDIERLVAPWPDNVEICLEQASACLTANNLNGALEALERVEQLDPGNRIAQLSQVEVLRLLGRDGDAMREADRAVELFADDYEAWEAPALVHVR